MSDDVINLDALSAEHLLRTDAEHKLAQATLQMEHLKWELEGVRHTQRVTILQNEANAANKAFLNAARTIEQQHNIELKHWGFMPETGALTRIGDGS